MSIPGSTNPLLLFGDATGGALQIERSLRFNSSDSGFLSRVPGTAGNRTIYTWSIWLKRSGLGEYHLFRATLDGSNYTEVYFGSNDKLNFQNVVSASANTRFVTTQVFRDTSAWYHLVFSINGSTAAKLYVNGVEVTAFDTTVGPGSSNHQINNTVSHTIGSSASSSYANFYLTNIHLIDGQALTPSSFTETDATTGQLIPKTYTGSYGTNGFNLLFADNSSNTASTLGKDTSGNSNNWTPNNLSVTAGAGNDSLVDSPTNYGTDTGVGGEVRGNYCTWNPLDQSGSTSLANGNLEATGRSSGYVSIRGSVAVQSGKFYFESTASTASGAYIGIADANAAFNAYNIIDDVNIAVIVSFSSSNGIYINSSTIAYTTNYSNNDVVGVAFDQTNKKVWFAVNNVWQGSGTQNPATNAGGYTYTGMASAAPYFADGVNAASAAVVANFGQRAFAYTAPSGFKTLCTQNLPEGTITTSGSFTGNANADGPFVYLNGVPTAMTINSNAVTFATHADKLSNGFKLRTSSGSYNTAGSNTYSITTTGDKFKYARAQPNP